MCRNKPAQTSDPSAWAVTMATLLPLLVVLGVAAGVRAQYEVCRSQEEPAAEFYACQPPPANMKEFMQIRVEPPGVTCGNPPERFCTLVRTRTRTHARTHACTHARTHAHTHTHA